MITKNIVCFATLLAVFSVLNTLTGNSQSAIIFLVDLGRTCWTFYIFFSTFSLVVMMEHSTIWVYLFLWPLVSKDVSRRYTRITKNFIYI